MRRSEMYLEAGADWIFPEALADREEFAAAAERIEAPLVANMTEFGKSPLLNIDELAELGYAAVLYPVTLLRVAMKSMETALAVLRSTGAQRDVLEIMQTRDELYDLLGYNDFETRDRRHFRNEG
jgi:methylisocitrate lyase